MRRGAALRASLGDWRIAVQCCDAVGEMEPERCSTMVVLSWTGEDREVCAAH
jgi:hypothetical protein